MMSKLRDHPPLHPQACRRSIPVGGSSLHRSFATAPRRSVEATLSAPPRPARRIPSNDMGAGVTEIIDLDQMAIRLAAEQGEVWHDLGDYPGYSRNRWREEARLELLKLMPEALVEALPALCDGREAGYIVRLPAKDL